MESLCTVYSICMYRNPAVCILYTDVCTAQPEEGLLTRASNQKTRIVYIYRKNKRNISRAKRIEEREKKKMKLPDRKLPFEVGSFCISKDNHI